MLSLFPANLVSPCSLISLILPPPLLYSYHSLVSLFLFPGSDYLPPLLSFLAFVSSPCKANRTNELKLDSHMRENMRSLSFWV